MEKFKTKEDAQQVIDLCAKMILALSQIYEIFESIGVQSSSFVSILKVQELCSSVAMEAFVFKSKHNQIELDNIFNTIINGNK